MLPGKFFDEIRVGDEHETPCVTVTEGHILGYGGIAGDFSPIHFDEVYARSTEFGGRIAHGLMGLSLTDGLKVQSAFFRDGIALSWNWRFRLPIRIGDTLQVRFRIAEARPSRTMPHMGILVIDLRLLNQRDETVQEGQHQLMVPRRSRDELVASIK